MFSKICYMQSGEIRNPLKHVVILIVLFLYLVSGMVNSALVQAETLYVNNSCEESPVPSPYQTLGKAEGVAQSGDTIILHEGKYPEHLVILKKLEINASNESAVIGQYYPSEEELAFHWAPVHYQDVDKGKGCLMDGGLYLGKGREDYLTRIDARGWDISLNWETDAYEQQAWVYYSVVSTPDHYYITFAFYHAMDTKGCAKNDMEGVILFIQRDGSDYGNLEAAITVFHTYIHAYFPADTPLELGCENDDMEQGVCAIQMQYVEGEDPPVERIKTSQQASGHGFGFYPAYVNEGNDAIVYVPSREEAGIPPFPVPDGEWVQVPYRLINIHAPGGLWAHRYDTNIFNAPSYLGMVGGHGNPPWQWNGLPISLLPPGGWSHDPVLLAQFHFKLKDDSVEPAHYFNREYSTNPYRDDMAILTFTDEDEGINAKEIFCNTSMSIDYWIGIGGDCRPSNSYPCSPFP